MWLQEGEAKESEPAEAGGVEEVQEKEGGSAAPRGARVQRVGQRLSDQLKRKPQLRAWLADAALRLDTTRNTTMTASRHPVIKTARLIVVGTALRLFGASRYAPVPCLVLPSLPTHGEPTAVAAANESTAGDVILPRGLDAKQAAAREAWAARKRPQLTWMLARLDDLIDKTSPATVLDVGGGKGDLAVWLARHRPAWRTVAIDVNARSVEAGRAAVSEAGFEAIARIEVCDATSLLRPRDHSTALDQEGAARVPAGVPAGVGSFDAVVGLHCCGGLTETALLIALQHRVPFCICTCCFCSHPHLARLLPEGESLTHPQ